MSSGASWSDIAPALGRPAAAFEVRARVVVQRGRHASTAMFRPTRRRKASNSEQERHQAASRAQHPPLSTSQSTSASALASVYTRRRDLRPLIARHRAGLPAAPPSFLNDSRTWVHCTQVAALYHSNHVSAYACIVPNLLGLISIRARLRRDALSVYQWIRVCFRNFMNMTAAQSAALAPEVLVQPPVVSRNHSYLPFSDLQYPSDM